MDLCIVDDKIVFPCRQGGLRDQCSFLRPVWVENGHLDRRLFRQGKGDGVVTVEVAAAEVGRYAGVEFADQILAIDHQFFAKICRIGKTDGNLEAPDLIGRARIVQQNLQRVVAGPVEPVPGGNGHGRRTAHGRGHHVREVAVAVEQHLGQRGRVLRRLDRVGKDGVLTGETGRVGLYGHNLGHRDIHRVNREVFGCRVPLLDVGQQPAGGTAVAGIFPVKLVAVAVEGNLCRARRRGQGHVRFVKTPFLGGGQAHLSRDPGTEGVLEGKVVEVLQVAGGKGAVADHVGTGSASAIALLDGFAALLQPIGPGAQQHGRADGPGRHASLEGEQLKLIGRAGGLGAEIVAVRGLINGCRDGCGIRLGTVHSHLYGIGGILHSAENDACGETAVAQGGPRYRITGLCVAFAINGSVGDAAFVGGELGLLGGRVHGAADATGPVAKARRKGIEVDPDVGDRVVEPVPDEGASVYPRTCQNVTVKAIADGQQACRVAAAKPRMAIGDTSTAPDPESSWAFIRFCPAVLA